MMRTAIAAVSAWCHPAPASSQPMNVAGGEDVDRRRVDARGAVGDPDEPAAGPLRRLHQPADLGEQGIL